jgi:phosphate-selective porin
VGALIRTGLQLQPSSSGITNGFEIWDARVNVGGSIGLIFDYWVEGAFETQSFDTGTFGEEKNGFTLLDAKLTIPIIPELGVSIGQFKTPFSREFILYKSDIQFVERSQVVLALAPGRQVGLQLAGSALETRLWYGAGMFNGNGRTVSNDNNAFMWMGRVQFNTVGEIEFYEDLVIQVGANMAFSNDSAVDVGLGGDLGPPPIDAESYEGDRFLWGFDAEISYRGFFVNGEYIQGRFSPSQLQDGVLLPTEPETTVASGYYIEGGYSLWGAIEGVLRYDRYAPADATSVFGSPDSQFLVTGINIYPGFFGKIALQYTFGLDGTTQGPALVKDQFNLLVQLSF